VKRAPNKCKKQEWNLIEWPESRVPRRRRAEGTNSHQRELPIYINRMIPFRPISSFLKNHRRSPLMDLRLGAVIVYILFISFAPMIFLAQASLRGPLSNGVASEGSITLDNPGDTWSFTASAGERIILRLASTNFTGRVELFGPGGALLGSGTSVTGASDLAIPPAGSFVVTNGGAFTVVVSAGDPGATGSYRLILAQPSKPWKVPVGHEGGPLGNGGNAGMLEVGNLDLWSFTANAGENIILRFASTRFRGQVELFGSDGASLIWNSDEGSPSDVRIPVSRSFAVTNAGTFTVVVSGRDQGATGSYQLSLAQPSKPWIVPPGKEGGPLANGVNIGTLALGGLDFWSFTARAGENIILRAASTSFRGQLELFGPDGSSLAWNFNDDTPSGTPNDVAVPYSASFAVPMSGTFTVIFSGWDPGSFGSYGLSLVQPSKPWSVPPGGEGGPLASEANSGALGLGSLDFWSFTGKAGENIILRLSSTNFTGQLELFGPDGVSLGWNGWDGIPNDVVFPKSGAFVVTNSGTFTVVASGWGPSATGPYLLRFVRVPGDFVVPAGDEGGGLPNAVVSGSIDLGDEDMWQFNACKGERFVVRLDHSTNLYPRLDLYGPDGTLLNSESGFDEILISRTATNCGTYLAVVMGGLPMSTGAYELSVPGYSGSLKLCPPQATNSEVIVTGPGGIPGAPFVLYTTTNIAVPPIVWSPFVTNRFDELGVLNATQRFDSVSPRFFRAGMPDMVP